MNARSQEVRPAQGETEMARRGTKGFTLIELLIVDDAIGERALTLIRYPSAGPT